MLGPGDPSGIRLAPALALVLDDICAGSTGEARAARAQGPLDAESAHAEEDRGPDMVGGADMDGTDFAAGQFHLAKGPFDTGEILAGQNSGICGQGFDIKAGADHTDAIQPGFGIDAVRAALPSDGPHCDIHGKMLVHLAAVDSTPHPPVERRAGLDSSGPDRGRDRLEHRLGRLQPVGAALRRNRLRISVVVRAVIQSSPTGIRSARMRAVVSRPRSPTIANTIHAETAPDPGHRCRHRAAIGRAEPAVIDLSPACLAITVIAKGRQRTALSLPIA